MTAPPGTRRTRCGEESTRINVIVDEDGVPKIATDSYVAVKVPVVPDFEN
jgi:hypothetical protein